MIFLSDHTFFSDDTPRFRLDTASIYPDDESFISWLEAVAEDHISDDRVSWFQGFVRVPELVDDSVAKCMEKIVSE